MSGVAVRVKGLRELNNYLQQLPVKVERRLLSGGLRAGAKVIEAEVESRAPVKTGQLRAGVKVFVRSRRGVVSASIRLTGEHAYIGYWFEFTGVAPHEIKPRKYASGGLKAIAFNEVGAFTADDAFIFAKVQHPGFGPRPFMRPAADAKSGEAVLAFANFLKKRLATKHGMDTSGIDVDVETVAD